MLSWDKVLVSITVLVVCLHFLCANAICCYGQREGLSVYCRDGKIARDGECCGRGPCRSDCCFCERGCRGPAGSPNDLRLAESRQQEQWTFVDNNSSAYKMA
nr:PREDICTED: uncharacterized protein LOC109034510 [Bemisia tabaci]